MTDIAQATEVPCAPKTMVYGDERQFYELGPDEPPQRIYVILSREDDELFSRSMQLQQLLSAPGFWDNESTSQRIIVKKSAEYNYVLVYLKPEILLIEQLVRVACKLHEVTRDFPNSPTTSHQQLTAQAYVPKLAQFLHDEVTKQQKATWRFFEQRSRNR